jgi:integrase
MAAKRRTRGSGSIRQRTSGKWQARLKVDGVVWNAPHTFDTKQAASIWLKRQHDEIEADTWAPPVKGRIRPVTFAEFAEEWLLRPSPKTGRDRAPRTVEEYRKDLDLRILPTLGSKPLAAITPAMVQRWYDGLDASKPTQRAHAYTLVTSIFVDAVAREIVDANPCRIRGASSAKRATRTDLPTPEQVQLLADAMPSEKYAVMVLAAAWCGLRFGELAELRRRDVALDAEGAPITLKVRRAVSRVKGAQIVGDPKSAAGVRNVSIPPHVRPRLAAYLDTLPKATDSLIFPATRTRGHMSPGSLHKVFDARADALGLDTLRFHDLRHFAGTQAAIVGATTAEVMARLGHSTTTAAMRYQHAAAGRDEEIAAALSNVVPIRRKA